MTNKLENSKENKPPNLLKEEQAKEQYSLANCGLHNHPLQGDGGLLKADKILYEQLKLKAQQMRLVPTHTEKVLWEQLKNKSLGVKFRRQHIIDKYVADFFCFEKGLIIELDGEIHDKQQTQDDLRQEALELLGYKVIRFRNEEVLSDLKNVIQRIKSFLAKPPNPLQGEQAKEQYLLTASRESDGISINNQNTKSQSVELDTITPFRGLGGS